VKPDIENIRGTWRWSNWRYYLEIFFEGLRNPSHLRMVLEYRTMDKIQKPNNSERFELIAS
jgi:hypothetical protein